MKQLLHNTKHLAILLTLATLLALPGMGWADNIIPIRTDVSGSTASGWTDTNVGGSTYLQLLITGANTITPAMNFNNYTSETLDFKARTFGTITSGEHEITVSISTDNGSNWTVLGTRTPASSTMTSMAQFNLSSYSGTQVKIKFSVAGTSATIGAGIDDITIAGTPAAGTPTIIVGTITGFGNQEINTTSAQKTFNVSGSDLTENITITPPSGFLISQTSGSGYSSNAINLSPSGGTVSSTPIYVVFNPTIAQAYSGNITHQSTGATTQNVVVSGTGTNPPPPDAPTATAATLVSSSGFTANWDAVSGATGYRLDVYSITAGATASDLFISEYIEGTSSNKYIEIFNGTGSSVDLSDYKLELYPNGGTVNPSVTLEGSLANGSTLVLKNSSASLTLPNGVIAYNNGAVNFNGDDAVALYKISTSSYVDIFGRIGNDPGTAWTGDGGYTTVDKTMVRKSTVTGGVTVNPTGTGPTAFTTLTTEWDMFDTDVATYLGSHSMAGGSSQSFVSGYQNLNVGDVTSYEVTGLDPATTYYYVVRAYNDYGTSASSDEIEVTTSLPEPTNYPTDFEATASVNRQLTVTWADATTGDQHPEAYLVKAAVYPGTPTPPVDGTFEANSELVLNVAQGTQTATFSDLMAGTKYNFAIWPYTNEGTEVDYKTGAQPTTSANTLIIPSTFTGTGNWSEAGKWSNGIPEYDYLAIINGSVTVDISVMVDSLIIAPTGRVTVHPDGYLDAMGFLIQSDASGTGSFVGAVDDYHIPTICTVQHYITGAPEAWHLISSPISDPSPQSISGEFTPDGSYPDGSGYDFYQWDEAASLWLNQKVPVQNILFFDPVRGYLVAYQAANPVKTFKGPLSSGIKSILLSAFGGFGVDSYSFTNLLGNPYPSSIDWKASNAYDKSQLEGYGTTGVNAYVYNDAANNYGVYNDQSSSDEGTNGASRYIAPMQGFFVIANGSGAHNQSFLIDDDARVHSPQSWLKSSDGQGFRLSVNAPGTNGSDQLLLEFGHETTVGAAEKWNSFVNTAPALYTSMNGKKYSISFLTSAGDHPVVPVALKPGVDGNYTLTADFNTGVFTKVTLTDSKTGASHDLKNNPVYSFTASVSDDENRFALHFSTVGISTPETSSIQVYSLEGRVYVNGAPANAQLSLTDITGRMIQRVQLSNTGLNTVNVGNLPNGVYVVTVNDGKHLVSHKIIL